MDDASIQALVDEFPEVAPLAQTAKALAKDSADLKQKNAELEARLQKLEQGVTQTQQQSQERAHFEQVVKPVMTAIDSIKGLDEARFGRFDGQNMTPAQAEQREAMVRLATRLSQERLRTHPIDHTLRGAELAKAWQAHDAAMLEAAHRTLTNKAGVRKEAPTTRSAVIQHARAQAASRSPIGVAASSGKAKAPSTPYTDSDDPVTALDKVFAAHQ
jgi:DNA repair exonuclease SbcCD ATPase subunit